MNDTVQQIKERLSIIDVVSEYVKLQKSGRNYKGLSPFSNERTPSFYVSPERDMYYCFSTNQGGDIFTFIEKMEGVDFAGALRLLADRAGVLITPYEKTNRDKRTRLYEALEAATTFYEKNLAAHPEVLLYLQGRGILQRTIKDFRVGFVEDQWRTLYEHLLALGYTESEMLEAGLIKKAEKKEGGTTLYDTFRGRIMFPIEDSAGRVVAFSGRIFKDVSGVAKYLNSPETPLYNKSKILFGYSKAKGGIKKFNFSVIVEGQMDVVLSHQAGYPNTVGVSGTALTKDQLILLQRLSKNTVMAFDADRAGIASAGRGASLALSLGMDVKVARLPQGVDPADLIKEDGGAWKVAIRESVHIIEFYLQQLHEVARDARAYKLKVEEVVLPFISHIESPIDQAHFIQMVAQELGTSIDVVQDALSRRKDSDPTRSTKVPAMAETFSRPDMAEEKLARIILWQETLPNPALQGALMRDRLAEHIGKERLEELLNVPPEQKNQDIFKAELLYEGDSNLRDDVEELLHHIFTRIIKRKLEETMKELKDAELHRDVEKTAELLKKSKELADKLAS